MRDRRGVVRRTTLVASWAVFAGFLATSLLAFIPPGESARPSVEPTRGVAARPPASGPATGTSRQVHWPADPRASAFDVILVTGDQRQDRWVKGTSIALRRVPDESSPITRWYVYPVYEVGGATRFGKLAAHGSLGPARVTFAAEPAPQPSR